MASAKSTEQVFLSVAEMATTPEGVVAFGSPAGAAESGAFRDALLPLLAAFGRSQSAPEGRDVVAITNGYLATQAMAAFSADVTIKRAWKKGHYIRPLTNSLTDAFLSGTPGGKGYDVLKHFGILKGPEQPRRWRAPARLARDVIKGLRPAIGRRHLLPVDMRSTIVATGVHDLMEKHARRAGEAVVYRPFGIWFRPAGKSFATMAESQGNDPLLPGLMDCIDQAYAEIGQTPSEAAQVHLARWTGSLLTGARWYLREALGRHKLLPNRLWTGTGGNFWARVLRHAVRRNGGEVTGHDHWISVGHLRDNRKATTEFEACDRFVTMTSAQAEGLAAHSRADHIVQSRLPRFESVGGPPFMQPPAKRPEGGAWKSGKRIMYVMDVYVGSGTFWIYPHHPDIVTVDWQARLIAKLEEWGYDVILKPHPESFERVDAGTFPWSRTTVVNEPFCKAYRDADILLFDSMLATSVAECMTFDKPAVMVQFGGLTVQPSARAMLAQRFGMVDGRVDQGGRLQVAWPDLRAALEAAPDLTDSDFYETYLRY